MAEETFVLIMLVVVMLVGSYLAGSLPLVVKFSEEKLQFVTVLGAGLLVGTALTVIIPEGIRSLYMDEAPAITEVATKSVPAAISSDDAAVTHTVTHNYTGFEDHSKTIGLSLILGFVFMMIVDQVSQWKSSSNDKNITATLGLVVHAAADGVALGAAATTSHQDVEIIVFLAIMLHKAPAAFGLATFLLHEKIDIQQIRKHLLIFSLSAPLLTLLTYFCIGQEQKETLNSVNATGIAMLFSAGTFLYVATVHVLPELTQLSGDRAHNGSSGTRHTIAQHPHYEYRVLEEPTKSTDEILNFSDNNKQLKQAHSSRPKGLRYSELAALICGAFLPLIITLGHQHQR